MSSWKQSRNQLEADDETVSPKRRKIDSESAASFITYGPKKVQGGDQVTLNVYCIDPHDSTFNNVVPSAEKEKDYTSWGHPKCCMVPGGENIDISVTEQTSDILTIDKDDKNKKIDANWSGFTSVEFKFGVGKPEESCEAKVVLNVSCGGSHLTDIKMTSNVNPARDHDTEMACDVNPAVVLSPSGNEPSAENAPDTSGAANRPDPTPVKKTDYCAGNQTKEDTKPSRKELKNIAKVVKDVPKQLAKRLEVSQHILKQRSPNPGLTVLLHWTKNSDTPTREHLLRCVEDILGTRNKDVAKLRAGLKVKKRLVFHDQ